MFVIFVACLIASPADCRQERLNLNEEALAPAACMMQAQPAMAEWVYAHPKYRIAKWRCTNNYEQAI